MKSWIWAGIVLSLTACGPKQSSSGSFYHASTASYTQESTCDRWQRAQQACRSAGNYYTGLKRDNAVRDCLSKSGFNQPKRYYCAY